MPMLGREFKVVCDELDNTEPKKNLINYKTFLDSVYITKMYMQELELYNTLKEKDT